MDIQQQLDILNTRKNTNLNNENIKYVIVKNYYGVDDGFVNLYYGKLVYDNLDDAINILNEFSNNKGYKGETVVMLCGNNYRNEVARSLAFFDNETGFNYTFSIYKFPCIS